MKEFSVKDKQNYENFIQKNEFLNSYNFKYGYSFEARELTLEEFCENLFYEAINNNIFQSSLQEKNHPNGYMLFYSYKNMRFFKKSLNSDNIYNLKSEGSKRCSISPNLRFGTKGPNKSLSHILNFDIDFDDVKTLKDFIKMLNLIESGEMLKPTIITSSGTGVHLIYRLKNPIFVYKNDELKAQMLNIKDKLCQKIGKVFGVNKINHLALDQNIRMVGSATKFAEKYAETKEECLNYVSKGWLIGDSIELDDILKFIGMNSKIEKPLKELTFKNYPEFNYGNSKYKYVTGKRNLYNGFLKKSYNAKEGNRYYAMCGVVAYGLKCFVPKKDIKKDLKLLQKHFNNNCENEITNEDIYDALKLYEDENTIKMKGSTIASKAGLDYKVSKRNGLCQKKHLKIIRKKSSKQNKNKILFKKIITLLNKNYDLNKLTIREIASLIDEPKTTVGDYLKKYKKVFFSFSKKLIKWLKHNISMIFKNCKNLHLRDFYQSCPNYCYNICSLKTSTSIPPP